MNQEARTVVRYELHGELITKDGQRLPVGRLDRSLSAWWQIVRLNLSRRQWVALRRNVTSDLTKTLNPWSK